MRRIALILLLGLGCTSTPNLDKLRDLKHIPAGFDGRVTQHDFLNYYFRFIFGIKKF